MVITPSSTVTFCKQVDIVPGETQIAFKTPQEQSTYFEGKSYYTYNDTTMVRKDGTLRVGVSQDFSPEDALDCNYLYFVNRAWGNKTFYGFITDVEYLNNDTMSISWVLDIFQSWMFQLEFDDMTIEREHMNAEDYQASIDNPYNPDLFMNRTAEQLPIGHDSEKPCYEIGLNGEDGVFIGERLCNELGITNRAGVLIAFCDMNLAAKDSAYTTQADKPGYKLFQILEGADRFSNMASFSVLSPATYAYFHNNFTPTITSRYVYDNTVWGQMIPGAGSRIQAPINYFFVDGGLTPQADIDGSTEQVSEILNWFATQGLQDSIIGMYPITTGMALFSGASYGAPFTVGLPTASFQDVHNTKLDLYPFTYYRLIAPNGDVKELRIEDFKDAQDSDSYCNLCVNMDIVGTPSLTVAPSAYRMTGMSPHDLPADANVMEALVFTQFPTLPYVIDGWKSQQAAIANDLIANRTTLTQYEMGQEQIGIYKSYLDSIFGSGTEAFGGAESISLGNSLGYAQLFKGGADAILGVQGGGLRQDALNLKANMLDDAAKVFTGNEDNAVYDNFKFTKPAYAQNQYYMSNGNGLSNFQHMSFSDVIFMRVSLNPSILEKYDQYFDRYGLASGRIGIPYICNYIQNQSGASLLPHWTDDNTTFVKTANCTCKGVPKPVMDAVNAMFNSGVRFLKGDTL